MKKTKTFFLAVLLAVAGSAQAADIITIPDVTIAPGTTAEIVVSYNLTEHEYVGFDARLTLPEDMMVTCVAPASVATGDEVECTLSTQLLAIGGFQLFSYDYRADGSNTYKFSIVNWNSRPLPASGELFKVTITADANAPVGTSYPVTLSNIDIIYNDDFNNPIDHYLSDVTFNIIVDDCITLKETDTEIPAEAENVKVRVVRSINPDEWSTICLPFGMIANQIEEAFPETNVQLADFIGCSEPELDDKDEVMSFSFKFSTNVTEIEPNHPYLIKVNKKIESFEVDGVTITPSDELSIDLDEIKWRQGGKWFYDYNSFIGTYEAQTVVPEDCLFLNGNKFWYSTGATKMKAFRGYFYSYNILGDAYKYGANSNVSLTFNDAEGILSVKVGDLQTEGTYDLQGRKVVGSLKRGIYIIDGKKIVIK